MPVVVLPWWWPHCAHLSRMGILRAQKPHWPPRVLSSQCLLEAVLWKQCGAPLQAQVHGIAPGLLPVCRRFQFPQFPQGNVFCCPLWAEMGKSPRHTSPSHSLYFCLSRKRQGKRTSPRGGSQAWRPEMHSSF